MNWVLVFLIMAALMGIYLLVTKSMKSRQLAYIKSYHFHESIRGKISKKYPHLNDEQSHLVFRALRDYF